MSSNTISANPISAETIGATATGASEILQTGLTGLAFLLAVVGVVALIFEIRQSNREPNGKVLGVICLFFLVTFALLVTVAGVDIYKKKVQLHLHVQSLSAGNPESVSIKVGAVARVFNEEGVATITIADEDSAILVLEALISELQSEAEQKNDALRDQVEAMQAVNFIRRESAGSVDEAAPNTDSTGAQAGILDDLF